MIPQQEQRPHPGTNNTPHDVLIYQDKHKMAAIGQQVNVNGIAM